MQGLIDDYTSLLYEISISDEPLTNMIIRPLKLIRLDSSIYVILSDVGNIYMINGLPNSSYNKFNHNLNYVINNLEKNITITTFIYEKYTFLLFIY